MNCGWVMHMRLAHGIERHFNISGDCLASSFPLYLVLCLSIVLPNTLHRLEIAKHFNA